jgi:hypothetical protein
MLASTAARLQVDRHAEPPGRVQDLHLVKAQCGASTLVAKVKLVERCFEKDCSVEFHMHDTAPSDPPAPLPYFVKPSGEIETDEKDLARYLAKEGAPELTRGQNIQLDALTTVLERSAPLNKAVKAAVKSKDAEVESSRRSRYMCHAPACKSKTGKRDSISSVQSLHAQQTFVGSVVH